MAFLNGPPCKLKLSKTAFIFTLKWESMDSPILVSGITNPFAHLLFPKNHSFSNVYQFSSVQFISVAQSCLTLCDPMNHSTPGLPVHHQLLEFTQTHVHRVSDAIQPSHFLSSPSPPAPNPSQHQSLFQWVNSSSFFVILSNQPLGLVEFTLRATCLLYSPFSFFRVGLFKHSPRWELA